MTELIKCVVGSGAILPHRGSAEAACWDIHAAEDAELRPYVATKIATNLRVELPKGHVLLLLPRSGFSFKNQILLPNSLGVIDSDYRGSMALTAMWMPDPVSVLTARFTFGDRDPYMVPIGAPLPSPRIDFEYKPEAVFKVKKGDRITQAMLLEYKEQTWEVCDALSETQRGDGGFGSTGFRAPDPTRVLTEKDFPV